MKNITSTFTAIIFAITIIIISAISAVAFGTAPGNDNFANAEVFTGLLNIHSIRTNVGATAESGEPIHGGVGGKSVWFKWTAPMSRVMTFTTNRNPTNMDTLIAVYSGSSLNNLLYQCSNDNSNSTDLKSQCRAWVEAGDSYYIAVDGKSVNGAPAVEGQFALDIHPSFPQQGADYDNDGITDISVFRPSDGKWYIRNTSDPQNLTIFDLGAGSDIPVMTSDTSGNNYSTIFRPSDGIWYPNVQTQQINVMAWGTQGDIPVPANYLDSLSTSLAVYRPSTGTWYIRYAAGSYTYYQFGLAGDIPVPGNYSPDRYADIAVFRPSNGTWYFIKRATTNTMNDSRSEVKFGLSGDKPVPADYDGDGILDVAVYRPSTGVWYVLRSSNGQAQAFHWGIAEDIPTTGDFDGDGKFDYAVFRPSTGNWYINRSSDGTAQIVHFGANGDIPVTASRTF